MYCKYTLLNPQQLAQHHILNCYIFLGRKAKNSVSRVTWAKKGRHVFFFLSCFHFRFPIYLPMQCLPADTFFVNMVLEPQQHLRKVS